jgi:hypothetical protein
VLPYNKILPEELYEDLLEYFLYSDDQLVKNSKPRMTTKEINIDSKIITIKHAELISKWIDKLENTDEIENFYKFKLLLRGSRDGFTPNKFHEICNNQPNTITVVKVKDSNEVLGGYNPIAWESNEFNEICDEAFSATKDSFIFSFNDINNIERFILSHIKNKEYAILSLCNFGPSFGGGDLDLYEDRGQCFNYDYEKPIREITKFSMEEYEVFQIIR